MIGYMRNKRRAQSGGSECETNLESQDLIMSKDDPRGKSKVRPGQSRTLESEMESPQLSIKGGQQSEEGHSKLLNPTAKDKQVQF